jgi:hypothetical protein
MSARLVPTPTRSEERVRQLGTLTSAGRAEIRLPRRRVAQPAIVSRLIAAVKAIDNPILDDNFERIVAAGGWGSPSTGPAYSLVTGTAADFSVPGNTGRISIPADLTRQAIESFVNVADVSFNGFIMSHSGFDPTTSFMGLFARGVGGLFSDLYYAIEVRADGVQVQLTKMLSGSRTVLATITPAVPLTFPVALNITCVGFLITGSAWNTAQPDPPMLSAIDLDFPNSGSVGAFAQSGVAAGTDVVDFDNFLVNDVTPGPTWDAYIDNTQLINIIDSSVVPVDRWIPQIVNGQRLNPGEQLIILPREGRGNEQVVVTCSFVYST